MTTLRDYIKIVSEGFGLTHKISKIEAHYTNSSNSHNRCGNCRHFIEPTSCEIVDGYINPKGWCKYYESA